MARERWQQKQLRELLAERPKNGYSPTEASGWTGSLMLGLGCLGPDGFRSTQLKNAPRHIPNLNDVLLSSNDVLISRSNTREAVGFVGIFRDVGAPCIYPDLMMRLKFTDAADARFAVRCLQSSSGRRQIEAAACGTSGSMVKLNRAAVEGFSIPAPPIPEQRRIAEILDSMDEAIRKTEQLIAKLKQVKQGLLHDLLTRGIDENGELRDPERNPEQFKKSLLGRIPKSWDVVELGRTLASRGGFLQTGPFGSQLHAHEYTHGSGVPVVMPQDIDDDAHISTENAARISSTRAERLARHRLAVNDVVFARRGDLSRCAAIGEREVDWICGTGCLLARFPASAVGARWFSALYRHEWLQRQIAGRAVGSTMVNLNTGILAGLVVPLPLRMEQARIEEVIQEEDRRSAAENEQLSKLRIIKQGLMEDLLTGRVPVTPLLNETTP